MSTHVTRSAWRETSGQFRVRRRVRACAQAAQALETDEEMRRLHVMVAELARHAAATGMSSRTGLLAAYDLWSRQRTPGNLHRLQLAVVEFSLVHEPSRSHALYAYGNSVKLMIGSQVVWVPLFV